MKTTTKTDKSIGDAGGSQTNFITQNIKPRNNTLNV